MKKILILYASKYGATLEVAQKIEQKIGLNSTSEGKGQVTMIDLKKQKGQLKALDFNQYHGIILGTSVYIGQPRSEFTSFVKAYGESLAAACSMDQAGPKLYLYVCAAAANEESVRQKIHEVVTPKLLKCSDIGDYYGVGHAIRMKKLNFLERMIMKKVKGTTADEIQYDEETIEKLVASIQGGLNERHQ